MYRKFKPRLFWPEQYRRTGELSIAFLFDENPGVASAGLGGAQSVPDRTARSTARPSSIVGLLWQQVSAFRPFGLNRIAAPARAAGRELCRKRKGVRFFVSKLSFQIVVK